MDVLSALLMLLGSLFVLVAGIGLHRFDDVFARTHAAGKATTFGLGLILLGSAIRIAEPGPVAVLALVGILALATIPAGAHLIGRAAFRSGTELAENTVLDERSARRFRHTDPRTAEGPAGPGDGEHPWDPEGTGTGWRGPGGA
jgi:multicomponent Na+:H+ antiporter subunit G